MDGGVSRFRPRDGAHTLSFSRLASTIEDILRPVTRAARFAAFALLFSLWAQHYARADSVVTDIIRTPKNDDLGKWKKLEGSYAELSTYIGSGTFYTSGYHDPYVSLALYAKPNYDLGTRYKLALRARLYIEEEFTEPDNPAGRHFYPYDPWLWLAADDLHTFERSKIRIGGIFRTIWPLSYESRYQNMIMAVGVGPTVSRDFEFGAVNDEARKWTLKLSYAFTAYKYFQTSHFRGNGPGDSTGCLAPSGQGAGGISAGGGPTAAAGDRCGGPANTNVSLTDTFYASLARGKFTLSMTLLIQNNFEYGFPEDALTANGAVPTGRTDVTWGIISFGYQYRPHIGFSAGISSLQPAMDASFQHVRFPFFDLSGGANFYNYTQVFLGINGTL